MIEENTIMQLIAGIKTGDISVIIGLAIIAIIAITRNAILPELTGIPHQITSSLAAALGGFAVLLAAGEVWWAALIVGLLAAPTSSGLVPLIRSIIRAFKRKPPPDSPDRRSERNRKKIATPTETPVAKKTEMRRSILIVSYLTLSLFVSSGCTGTQKICNIEKTIVNAVGVGLSATDSVIGETGGEDYDTAIHIANGVHFLGQQAIAACELARDSAAWQQWVLLALETVGAVIGVIEGAGDGIENLEIPAPPELHRAVVILRSEVRQQ